MRATGGKGDGYETDEVWLAVVGGVEPEDEQGEGVAIP